VTDRKTLAIILGAVVGVAAVTATVVVYTRLHREAVPRDINDVFDRARQTVRKLDEAVEQLRQSAA